ncbi:MAG: CRISPR-associated endonuclease Cas2 [Planctomycetaceae bacterium]
MKRCYLVCYDIADPKRLRQVFKICKGYGEHWQYSIFFCVLKDLDRVRMQAELEEVMHHKQDQILMMDLGQDETSARGNTVALGQPMDDPLEGTVLV